MIVFKYCIFSVEFCNGFMFSADIYEFLYFLQKRLNEITYFLIVFFLIFRYMRLGTRESGKVGYEMNK